ncbi:hypothetical protein Plhal304r1_c017g0061131 [Plasmopara halstedii]
MVACLALKQERWLTSSDGARQSLKLIVTFACFRYPRCISYDEYGFPLSCCTKRGWCIRRLNSCG